MNIIMTDVVFIDARGTEYAFDSFFAHARNVRYIHIPDQVILPLCYFYVLTFAMLPLQAYSFIFCTQTKADLELRHS